MKQKQKNLPKSARMEKALADAPHRARRPILFSTALAEAVEAGLLSRNLDGTFDLTEAGQREVEDRPWPRIEIHELCE